MDLELSDDQQLFVETTRKFLDASVPMTVVRGLHESGQSGDPALWRQGAELGWTAALVPESLGGGSVSEAGLLDLALVAEELGRSCAPGPFLSVNVVADAIARLGTPEQQALLAGLVAGDLVAAWAFDGGDERWDGTSPTLTARRDGDAWVLDGTRTFVADATLADWFLVTAPTDGGLTQFLLPRDTAGLSVEPLGSLDLVRSYGELRFDGVRLDGAAVLGAAGAAADDVERQLQVALVLQNAETVGAVTAVFEMTLHYAQDRIAFGRPIGSYQALKHRFSDMKAWLEACHATANASARAVATDDPDAGELVRVAKAYIADRSPQIAQDCVQLHGGIGVTWEHDLHVYLRRITQNMAIFGGVRHHRSAIADRLGI